MPPTLQTVMRRMHLKPLAGTARPGVLDAPVRWVAVSELSDPTPYLEGGELLLTTGLRMDGDLSGYVARLVRRGVSGLGFGVGVSHEETPPGLIEAAEEAGLPLLEVPREMPFIAIGKAVSELLAAEQYEEISRAFAAQGRLTRAALRQEGMVAVIDRLAKEVGGWAALLDESGEVRHATPGARTEAVAAELSRRRGRPFEPSPPPGAGSGAHPGRAGETRPDSRGPAGGTGRPDARPEMRKPAGEAPMPASLALSAPGEHIVVQPLGGGGRPRGFFAVGAGHAFSPVTHTVINAAGSLLTLSMEQGRAQRAAERSLRAAVLELLLAGEEERARAVLGRLGGRLPGAPVVALAAGPEALDALEPVAFAALTGVPDVVALVPEQDAEEVALRAGAPVGVSLPTGYDSLRDALDQARRALEAAGDTRRGPVVRFGELAGQGLLALLDPAAAHAFSTAVLAPLNAYGSRADLVESLRAYLESNGHWDAAAQRLGVHRHTLRYRMRRVAELLGRDLDDPGVRAELWLALEAAGRPRAKRRATPASRPGSSR
ncbi:PucR family transcriptional regulator ligand-binding domain-containing protein [Nonomuraea sp. NPDC049309]|uniref:PucR family transcriptional regulator ligand-binding domain-containing protein n=1 Tax=Nonomuraea sp. NPDC049309 TaxID=3364350 RepID=UPI00371B7D5B